MLTCVGCITEFILCECCGQELVVRVYEHGTSNRYLRRSGVTGAFELVSAWAHSNLVDSINSHFLLLDGVRNNSECTGEDQLVDGKLLLYYVGFGHREHNIGF